jgi:hypothetical protein
MQTMKANSKRRGIIQVDMGTLAAKLKLRRLARSKDLTVSQIVRKALRPLMVRPESPRA